MLIVLIVPSRAVSAPDHIDLPDELYVGVKAMGGVSFHGRVARRATVFGHGWPVFQ